ncbi:ATP-dependent DNA helicase RecG [Mammaliicoccus lentus]|uniref:ATP-dependent DNA helicase RecG n=1 Tax=Mammaliicoccus lentus TaxID=42858 RepID=UPI0024A7B139|nr:ATP-dependent DNA helicase RecG [Mammaliicoccus lentus]MDQ7143036.1 ATP-dependent DNA helicase RecG [Mammaliicoccus lentus]WHI53824.1 ATP-dependent DNA helicase RecG [Mammaliicoccus lentus]WHI56412.1 ATP-dependent DNA helicase RecG [Mammaliicoccus lentus]WHI64258.1 ATP-dependent DNA helicase RecG [Mammaliicoccus lentus]WHI85151.1 ATP-dependent DNA helicase RecG [Mammaliicoccus lentus]
MKKQHLIYTNHTLQELKGVGPKSLQLLNELNIHTLEDLVLYLPTRYEDESVINLNEASDSDVVTVTGEVYSSPTVAFFGRNRSKLTCHMMINDIAVKVTFFNQPYLKKRLVMGETVTVKGKWEQKKQIITGQKVMAERQEGGNTLTPIYRLKEGLKQKQLNKYIEQALSLVDIDEWLSEDLISKYKLMSLKDVIPILHRPIEFDYLKMARRTFAFNELFLFQLKMKWLSKLEKEANKIEGLNYNVQDVKEFIDTLPFELTDAQKSSVNEIFRDLKAPIKMHRLLQGDVGSGKTVVAAITIYAMFNANKQSALMVPTEILAEQHAISLDELFGGRLNVALLTSSVKGKKRKLLLEQLRAGQVDILVGTHALIQDDVEFNDIGLVIIDEQHRFGVNQRKKLREKGADTNVLFMTATPIPRTLSISAFGEMDVSSIKQMPKGRKEIITSWAKHDEIDSVLNQLNSEIVKGRQAYVICPLIEESEALDVQNVTAIYEQLQLKFGSEKVGLLHGKMTSDEKDHIMNRFSNNEIAILVSTTVVEVGVNVPNATFMIIYDADRFGLSTLHQLRGRVGRSNHQSYCTLVASPKTESGVERMHIMTESTDGFYLSERDLEMRGPGDFFGVKQSGLPDFRVANIVEDYRMLEVARDEASELVQSGEFFKPKYDKLRLLVQETMEEQNFD